MTQTKYLFSKYISISIFIDYFQLKWITLVRDLEKRFHLLTFYILKITISISTMFEKFRKKKDDSESVFSGTTEDIPNLSGKTFQFEPKERVDAGAAVIEESRFQPSEQVKIPEHIQQTRMSASEDIGIKALMDKRTKLEEAIDYVGLMIKDLKDKRTNLEKSIEDESVDIKNLKEKLVKVGQYIEEEKQGIKTLQQKRGEVEKEADTVATMINNLRERLISIDQVVNEEGNKIAKFKETRPKTESSLT
jgi:chromosome segregation ATPase